MWRFYGGALAGLTLWLGCASSPSGIPPVSCEVPHLQTADLPDRGISAHRGGQLGCPVNTNGAFQRAICLGVHQIELDVRSTADAVLVVSHDDRVTDGQGRTLRISKSTLGEVQSLQLEPCAGEEAGQRIPTFEETLAMMPHNIWINVDIKQNDPLVGRLVAETVANAQRFNQVIFGARDHTGPAVRRVAVKADEESWVVNMSREIFRFQYVDTTIHSCDEFIQLSFLRGRPGVETIDQLKQAGIRVNYSWLRDEDERELRQDLSDLFVRGVDFVLVDHVGQAMKGACALGITPIVPHWNGTTPFTCSEPPRYAPE
ncbi:glycerophosphodiester phosphodiesterase [Candidatus Nitrospira neomarina]|uniref:Glycerophosphodiester phosphodiesterase family protein n=1 Tax=Candidatus Nitrospira neomarina TaxID=3020899 RepID=A0AA96GQJ6_9BACT|nr:glycerophosphodiester phosphodiesterase family protein [Candidatus Nitrospira neomarina]WNM62314.1 glycerophosphodiester phosphodiesterase family protein [Candidatus Nitrospira neomarina]